ncbi:hypothetical protein GETHPA_23320 [Geothrix rubra]|uniref:TIR domain-containing protein n=1 Tax=Geothrix rubra TaxID=2927977 RepID=A0ABQ5Q9T0_9BACT|nr:TIR domain-containing protein [Geothrix rubra]GLH70799.1 hypothetical protein GETHPA_23320 [Geothrix rubra]
MKVFISWSGTTSHKVALALRDWLPSVIQTLKPYVSSEDIDKGARWSSDIAGELDASSFGILCLTKDNIEAPWLNFEAGALSKSIDKSRVCPFLFRVDRSDVEGPVLQFQSTIHNHDDVLKLVKSLNNACQSDILDEIRLEKSFEVWWPRLQEALSSIPDQPSEPEYQPDQEESNVTQKQMKVLEEILELSRNNHKILRDPTSILPPGYVEEVFDRFGKSNHRSEPAALEDLYERCSMLLEHISLNRSNFEALHPELDKLIVLAERVESPLRWLMRRHVRPSRRPLFEKS